MIFLALLSLCLSYYWLSKVNAISFVKLNFEACVFIFTIFISIFGSVVFYYSDINYATRFIKGDDVKYISLISVCYVCTSLTLFYYIFSRLFKLERVNEYFTNSSSDINFETAQIIIYCIYLIVCIATTFYVFSKVDNIPVASMIMGDFDKSMRYDAKFGFTGSTIVRNLLMVKLSIVLSHILFSYSLSTKKNILVAKLMFFCSLLLAINSVLFYGSKAPIIIYILSLYINYIFTTNRRPIKFFILFVAVMVAAVLLLFYLINNNFFFSLYSGVVSRILVIPILGHILTLDIFPNTHEFLMGASLPSWITGLFGTDSVRSSLIVMSHINPEGVSSGTSGVVSSLFSAEAYANFGYIGLLLSPIYVALVVNLIRLLILKLNKFRHKRPENIFLYSYICFYLPFMGGFVDFIWSVGTIFVLIVSILPTYFKWR